MATGNSLSTCKRNSRQRLDSLPIFCSRGRPRSESAPDRPPNQNILVATDTLWRKVWISVAITAAFIAATILFVSVPASRFSDSTAREYAAAITRVVLAVVTTIALRKSNWASNALRSPTPRSWWIILPVAIYSLIVYPLLFTGTLALNLSDPNLAGGVACNGFAAGALEELVFRGLILSRWLSSDLEGQSLKNAWRAI